MKNRLCNTCVNLEFDGGCSASFGRKHCCYYKQETEKAKAIRSIIDRAGGYDKVSRVCGVHASAIYRWKERKKGIPKKYWGLLSEMARRRGHELKEKDLEVLENE